MSNDNLMKAKPVSGALMLDLEGYDLTSEDENILHNPHVGGVIFFKRNFSSLMQIKSLVAQIRAVRPDILLAVDQEGGRVQRFQSGFTQIPPMQKLGLLYQQNAAKGLALAKETGWLMAAEILSCDIDFSFAPVLDVDENFCSVIADRSFSSEPDAVTKLAGAFIKGMHEAGMGATGKHFPGHGKVQEDSHEELPVDNRLWSDIETSDLRPFSSLINSLDAIMPAHIQFPQVDTLPVGFSPVWLQQKLRKELAFEGVVFSDDLSMKGAHCAGSFGERAEKALHAGCDMVLVCNDRDGAREVLEKLCALDWQSSERLSGMRRRKIWKSRQLEDDERWQKAAAAVEALNKG